MFELLIKVCVGTAICYYSTPPITYDTLETCQMQAGLIAGLRSGQNPPGLGMHATYRCRGLGMASSSEENWYEISLLAPKG